MFVKIFTKFSFLAVSLVLLLSPLVTQAQSGRVPQTSSPTLADSTATICLNTAEGGVYRLAGSGSACAQGYNPIQVNTSQNPYSCVYKAGNNWVLEYGSDEAAGRQACNTAAGRFYTTMSNMPTTAPTTGSTTPTTPGTNPGTTPTPSTTPTPAPVPNPNTRPQVQQTQGDCDPEFVKEGALCVPKREPCDGFVCAQTVGDLAASILRILLVLAGIVAVIFSVIGGYQVITASSNETQATDGKKTLRNALIGLAIVMASYALITVLIDLITNNV